MCTTVCSFACPFRIFVIKLTNDGAGVLLIAGGIGVTPMRVMFAECILRGYPVTLLYSVRKEEDAAFLEEFREVRTISAASATICNKNNKDASSTLPHQQSAQSFPSTSITSSTTPYDPASTACFTPDVLKRSIQALKAHGCHCLLSLEMASAGKSFMQHTGRILAY